MTATVLALNSGSSSLKFGLYRADSTQIDALLCGRLDSIEELPERLAQHGMPGPTAIGHRVVHGGPALRQHVVLDDVVSRHLESATPFAPLHMPAALAVIRSSRASFPGLPHVVCFDTAFHSSLPDAARVLPIARELRSQGIERYGFHGLSCESIVHRLAHGIPERVLIAHLGNGASVTAVRSGRSVDTSMGLTPSGGSIMGTRSGDLDPGVLVYLMREKHFDVDLIEDLVNHRSGLLGISGFDSDMQRLHESESSSDDARLAIEMFCISVRKHIASMITVLGGVDLIVFTGGIGENDAAVRAAICQGLAWFGIRLDPERNRTRADPISDGSSRCVVRVIDSREDDQIARHTWRLSSGCR